ncbi:MAG TPA: heavy metal-binding domain-containing protein [Thermoguttaceae bacterium]|nr:heavy metal-binding domain-containing protein [Thermoguttaceae bacterium]
MSKRNRSTTLVIALITALSVWAMAATDASAQGMPSAQQHPGHSPAGMTAPTALQPTPHGGQLSVAGPLRFEVVYLPQETRVYLYDASNRPMSARGAAGQVALTVRGYEKVYRYPLAYVATQAGSGIQDHLALAVNVSRIKNGDMTAAFELTNLPSRHLPGTRFTQTFALSSLPVTVAPLTEADRAGIARQKVCAVRGSQLGSMGTPVKVLLGDQPIYLCCKGCLGKVQKNPAAYLPKATPAQSAQSTQAMQPIWTCSMHPQIKVATQGRCPICGMNLIPAKRGAGAHAGHTAATQPGTAMTNKIAVSSATSADQAAIAQQRVCAVSGSRLGGMGTPVKVTMNGQSLFLCCKGCVGKVEKDPAGYVAKAAQLRAGR